MLHEFLNRFGLKDPVKASVPDSPPYRVIVVNHKAAEAEVLGLRDIRFAENPDVIRIQNFDKIKPNDNFVEGVATDKIDGIDKYTAYIYNVIGEEGGSYFKLWLPTGEYEKFTDRPGNFNLYSTSNNGDIEAILKRIDQEVDLIRYPLRQEYNKALEKAEKQNMEEVIEYRVSQAKKGFIASFFMMGALGVLVASAAISIGSTIVSFDEMFSIIMGLDPAVAGALLIGGAGGVFGIVGLIASFCSDSLRDWLYKPSDGVSNFACKFIGFGMVAMATSAIILLALDAELEQPAKICIAGFLFMLALIASITVSCFGDPDRYTAKL